MTLEEALSGIPQRRQGLDEAMVREVMARFSDEVESGKLEIQRLEAENARLARERDEATRLRDETHAKETAVAAALVEAERLAFSIREEARREAEEAAVRARSDAEAVVARARQEAATKLQEAAQQVSEMLTQAHNNLAQVNRRLAGASEAATAMAARLREVALDLDGAVPPEAEQAAQESQVPAVLFEENLEESAD